MSTYQLAVLLLFNDDDDLTSSYILTSTNLSERELEKTISLLVDAKLLLREVGFEFLKIWIWNYLIFFLCLRTKLNRNMLSTRNLLANELVSKSLWLHQKTSSKRFKLRTRPSLTTENCICKLQLFV